MNKEEILEKSRQENHGRMFSHLHSQIPEASQTTRADHFHRIYCCRYCVSRWLDFAVGELMRWQYG